MVMITRRHRCIGIGVCLLMEAFCSALLLASCSSSSPMIPSIFLMSLWYNQGSPEFDPAQVRPITSLDIGKLVGDAELEARVGYVAHLSSERGLRVWGWEGELELERVALEGIEG